MDIPGHLQQKILTLLTLTNEVAYHLISSNLTLNPLQLFHNSREAISEATRRDENETMEKVRTHSQAYIILAMREALKKREIEDSDWH